MEYDIYGKVRKLVEGDVSDCPFRYQGQYEDAETGLYYNRFRYYDSETGRYISQDPIRLGGGKAFYNYVTNSTALVDVLGLTECKLSEKDRKKLMQMFSDDGIENPHFHHIVREMAPSNWPKKFRKYITDSQEIIKKAGVDLNTDIRNFTRASNGNGAHTQKAAKYVYDELIKSNDVVKTLGELADKMNKGIFF